MKYIDHYNDGELAEVERELDVAERAKIMLAAFRRAPTITRREAEDLKRRYVSWREERLTPFIHALARLIVADLTRGAK